MRPGRFTVLVGTLMATGALYLAHLSVEPAAFRILTGGSVPSIWQELGRWGRPVAALLAGGLVACSFRPGGGRFDRWGGVIGVLLAGGALAGCVLARQAAATDAAVVSAALERVGEEGTASAGVGFWVLIAGAVGLAGGVGWDLVAAWRRGSRAGSVAEADLPAVE